MFDIAEAKNRFRAIADDVRQASSELQRELEQYVFLRRFERLKKLKKKISFSI
jgi:hypothetical protein